MSVEIFTDGACAGNPGPGGWGAILRYRGIETELSGAEECTTNNRMELIAVIKALEALRRPCEVDLYSDSRYVCDAVNQEWIDGWIERGWRTSGKSAVANRDLWERLLPLLSKHSVVFHWIKGHAGHPKNERCDAIARSAVSGICGVTA